MQVLHKMSVGHCKVQSKWSHGLENQSTINDMEELSFLWYLIC